MNGKDGNSKPLSKEAQDVIDYVENFIRKMRNGDYIISPEARNILFDGDKKYDSQIGKFVDSKVSLSEMLAEKIDFYELYKFDSSLVYNDAARCRSWITTAFAHGVILENKDRLHARIQEKDEKIDSLLTENEELKKERDASYEENAKLLYDIAELKGRIKELNEKFNRMVPGGDNYGE